MERDVILLLIIETSGLLHGLSRIRLPHVKGIYLPYILCSNHYVDHGKDNRQQGNSAPTLHKK